MSFSIAFLLQKLWLSLLFCVRSILWSSFIFMLECPMFVLSMIVFFFQPLFFFFLLLLFFNPFNWPIPILFCSSSSLLNINECLRVIPIHFEHIIVQIRVRIFCVSWCIQSLHNIVWNVSIKLCSFYAFMCIRSMHSAVNIVYNWVCTMHA